MEEFPVEDEEEDGRPVEEALGGILDQEEDEMFAMAQEEGLRQAEEEDRERRKGLKRPRSPRYPPPPPVPNAVALPPPPPVPPPPPAARAPATTSTGGKGMMQVKWWECNNQWDWDGWQVSTASSSSGHGWHSSTSSGHEGMDAVVPRSDSDADAPEPTSRALVP